MNIYQKLIEVRKAVPYLKKDNKGHQFNFVSSSQTLANVRAKMDEMQLLLVPSVTEKRVSDHTTKNGGHEYFTEVDLIYTWINAENPDEKVQCNWLGQGLDTGEKGVGKALTYAEKYFILKFFNIPTDKDDPDSFQGKAESTKPKQPKPLKWYINDSANNADTVETLTAWWKDHDSELKALTKSDYQEIKNHCAQLKELLLNPEAINEDNK